MGRLFPLAVVELEYGEWLTSVGRADEAQEHLNEALAIFERCGAKPWIARARQPKALTREPAPV
jgi:hypothetical protein